MSRIFSLRLIHAMHALTSNIEQRLREQPRALLSETLSHYQVPPTKPLIMLKILMIDFSATLQFCVFHILSYCPNLPDRLLGVL